MKALQLHRLTCHWHFQRNPGQPMYNRYLLFLCLLLTAKAAAMLLVILHAGIGLGPDEAQYWTWSRQLDWGYYSKPPGIAWEIWLGTAVFGDTELGVRAPAVAIGFLLPVLVYVLAKACQLRPATCFWAGAAFALSPAGIMASLLAITDGGLVLFWTMAVACLAGALERQRPPNYVLLGLLIGLGALFKWPAYVLWIFVAALWAFFPWMASWKVVLGVGVSLLALVPTAYWNASHDWVTFRHVLSTLLGGHGKAGGPAGASGNLPEFIGSQAALLSPVLFVLLLLALWRLFGQRRQVSRGLLFCGGITLAILSVAVGLSAFMKMQGNWGIFVYPTAVIVISWYACEGVSWGKKWLAAGCGLSVALCAFAFAIPYWQSASGANQGIPYRMNPFRHNVGWEKLSGVLTAAGYDPQSDFLFGDKYQMTSILSFYGPEQKRAYFFNLQGTRKNQFSYWPGMDDAQRGRRGFFVVVENSPHLEKSLSGLPEAYVRQLTPYFAHVRYLGVQPLFKAYGAMAKGALVFECTGYVGGMPKDPELY